MKRVLLIVLDSVGIGELPDAADFGDVGSHTLGNTYAATGMKLPHMTALGLGNITNSQMPQVESPTAVFGRLAEITKAKDTTCGHWEMAGIVMDHAFVTYPNGFPRECVDALEKATGRKAICNLPYSGTKVIDDYGDEHVKTGDLIVYTSADSVLQIAAHEDVIPIEELYRICEIAYEIAKPYHVGRIIARPFVGSNGKYTRTKNRRDFSVPPISRTVLDAVKDVGQTVLGIGKIEDIFSHQGLTNVNHTTNNADGIEAIKDALKTVQNGLIFVNLVDTDMLFGHRNDPFGYAKSLEYFDAQLPEIMELLTDEDLLIITADHGCDPTTPSTDHSREYIPVLIYQNGITPRDFGTGDSFVHIAATVAKHLGVTNWNIGESLI